VGHTADVYPSAQAILRRLGTRHRDESEFIRVHLWQNGFHHSPSIGAPFQVKVPENPRQYWEGGFDPNLHA
jgi:hypothetical protein